MRVLGVGVGVLGVGVGVLGVGVGVLGVGVGVLGVGVGILGVGVGVLGVGGILGLLHPLFSGAGWEHFGEPLSPGDTAGQTLPGEHNR